MANEIIQIEDRLHSAGYKTERIGSVVNVHDPVHVSIPGATKLMLSHHELREIRSIGAAWKFLDDRS